MALKFVLDKKFQQALIKAKKIKIYDQPYGPFLEIYQLQNGSMVSILERITGVFIGIFMFLFIFFLDMEETFWVFYYFYKSLFIIFHGNYFLIDCILVFLIFNFCYHFFYLPVFLRRILDEPIDISDRNLHIFSIFLVFCFTILVYLII